MIYFGKASFRIREYMCDNYYDREKFHTVEADTEQEASEKIVRHYENKSDSFGTYFSGIVVEIFEHVI